MKSFQIEFKTNSYSDDHEVLINFPGILLFLSEDFQFILCYYFHLLLFNTIAICRRFDILNLNFFDKDMIRIFFSLMFLILFKVSFLFSLLFDFVHNLLMKLVNQEVKNSEEDYLNARKSLNYSNLFQLLSILFYSRYL